MSFISQQNVKFLGPKAIKGLLVVVGCATLLGCSGAGIKSDTKYKDEVQEEMYKHGSLVSDEGGFTLLGDRDKKNKDNNGLGVNGYLWRAALDTISFMPIASADPFGGVITTDWYTPPSSSDERVKVNLLILSRELRADGIKVSTFRQTRDAKGMWADAPVSPSTATALEETVLTRARELKIAQRDRK
jgi:hypothetical protein